MKMLSTYRKEMKIAMRGFYFYIEIFIAVVMLLILLVAIKENPDSKQREYVFYDARPEVVELLFAKYIDEGKIVPAADTEIVMKPASFAVKNRDTGSTVSYSFDSAKTIMARTMREIDVDDGRIKKTIFLLDTEEDVLRLSHSSGQVGAIVSLGDRGTFSYRYILQGYETERLTNLLYVYNARSVDVLEQEMDRQAVRELGSTERLNARESAVPALITFAGSLMGFFIVMSYLFLDKDQGVIRALAVTPATVWMYLLSKTMVIMTTVLISSSIVVIPVMGLKPNYLLFYPFLLATTFAFAAIGLLVASFFDSMSKSFGVLYLLMIAFMLPGFSYFIGSFDPVWLRFFPTYPILYVFKMIMLGKPDVPYVLTASAGFLVGGLAVLAIANEKFKKTLTV